VLAGLGVDDVDLVRLLRTFNAAAPPFRDESVRIETRHQGEVG
jgi:hypothetical protein